MLIHLNHVAHVYIVLRQHVRQMLLRHDQVKCVSSTHWDNIDVRQSPNQGRHRLNIVIDTPQQDTLVPDSDTCLQQFLRGFLRDPRMLMLDPMTLQFLNKCDLLQKKLTRGVKVIDYITTYGTRANDAPTAAKCAYVAHYLSACLK